MGSEGGGGGFCVAVAIVSIQPGGRSPRHRKVMLAVQVNENPAVNWDDRGRNLASEDLAAYLELPLSFTETVVDEATVIADGWTPSGIWTHLEFAGIAPVLTTPSRVVWDARFTTETIVRAGPGRRLRPAALRVRDVPVLVGVQDLGVADLVSGHGPPSPRGE